MQTPKIPTPALTKIPGELPKCKQEKYVEDLSKLTKIQLLEIKEREEKLLSNKIRISKLPDKGKRIQDFYEKVLREIQQRDEIEQAAALFSDLNIASTGEHKLNSMEWEGKYNPEKEETMVDSDDEDESDPLKIIAGSRLEKKVKILKPETPLITDEDLKEIESFKIENENIIDAEVVDVNVSEMLPSIKSKLKEESTISSNHNSSTSSLDLEPHVLYLIEKEHGLPQKDKFRPYKTTISNVHDPEKEKQRKLGGNHWEITAATPPPIKHSGTQLLPLKDSVELQMQYLDRLKSMQEIQAEERLKAKAARATELGSIICPVDKLVKSDNLFGNHRTPVSEDDELVNLSLSEHELKIHSDDEIYDDEEEMRSGGAISYTVHS